MPHTARAFQHMNTEVIPEIKAMNPESLLYVGWRRDTNSWWDSHFRVEIGVPQSRSAVIEIFDDNYRAASSVLGRHVFHGDIREIEKHVFPGEFDIIFWDHGPEHVSNEDLEACTPKLFSFAGKALIYCCPWGLWPQGVEGGNVNEVHYEVGDDTLRRLGMKVTPLGGPGQDRNGELIGVMKK